MQRLQIYRIPNGNWIARLSRGHSPEDSTVSMGECEDRSSAIFWARYYSRALTGDVHERATWAAMADRAAGEVGASDIVVGAWDGCLGSAQ